MKTEKITDLLLVVAATLGSFVTNMLGGWDVPLKVLIGMMAADYITGILVAAFWKRSNKSHTGALDSRAGFKGLCRKGVMLLLVWVGNLLDEVTGGQFIRTAVCLFFVGNEGMSLLENLGLMGVPFPDTLKQALDVLREQGNKGRGGSNVASDIDNTYTDNIDDTPRL